MKLIEMGGKTIFTKDKISNEASQTEGVLLFHLIFQVKIFAF